jgi:acyl-CoA dehydrogenase
MKFYAYRALDYFQAACADDPRYLLWSAVQKARVSTEGVKVMGLLSESVGARGFEAQTYFEPAFREVQLIPGLEGSTHINYGLTAQLLDAYFAAGPEATPPESLALSAAEPGENPYWMEARDRSARTVRFAHFLRAYLPLRSLANVRSFPRQVRAFRALAEGGVSALNHAADAGLSIAIGKCFSVIAYGQLVAENCLAAGVPLPAVSVIFHRLIEDLSAEALKPSALFPTGGEQRPGFRESCGSPGRAPRTWGPCPRSSRGVTPRERDEEGVP